MIADTPEPPYLAVIFTSLRTDEDDEGYAQTAAEMVELAAQQPGFLGVESSGRSDDERQGITVSYWRDEESIAAWRAHADHAAAQRAGRQRWYRAYALRVAEVTRARIVHTRAASSSPS